MALGKRLKNWQLGCKTIVSHHASAVESKYWYATRKLVFTILSFTIGIIHSLPSAIALTDENHKLFDLCESHFLAAQEDRDPLFSGFIRAARADLGDTTSKDCAKLSSAMRKIKTLNYSVPVHSGFGLGPDPIGLDLAHLVLLPSLEELSIFNQQLVVDLSVISRLVQLKKLNLGLVETFDGQIEDLSFLEPLLALEELNISGQKVRDYSPLLKLHHLKSVTLGWSAMEDLKGFSALAPSALRTLKFESIYDDFDATELKSLTRLETLVLEGKELDKGDLAVISGLAELRELYLRSSSITDATFVKTLKKLENLQLQDNPIQSAKPLEGLKDLKSLSIRSAPIKNVEALSALKRLEELVLEQSGVIDISFAKDLVKLRRLSIRSNEVASLSALSDLVELEYVDASSNKIQSTKPLAKLSKLKSLNLNQNPLSGIQPLEDLQLEEIFLQNTGTSDVSVIGGMNSLRIANLSSNKIKVWNDSQWVKKNTSLEIFSIDNNQLVNLIGFSEMTNLKFLHVEKNKIDNLEPISGLSKLEYLFLGLNQIPEITPLKHLKNLQQLTLWYQSDEKGQAILTSLAPLSELPDSALDLEGSLDRKLAQMTFPYLRFAQHVPFLLDGNKVAMTEQACPCQTGNINLRHICKKYRYGQDPEGEKCSLN